MSLNFCYIGFSEYSLRHSPSLTDNTMLSSTAFQSLSKAEAYKLYSSIYEKYEEKDRIISTFITNLESKLDNLGSSTGRKDKSTGNIPEQKVREFQPVSLKPDVKNLVIGSSLVKRFVDDNSIPTDIGIHAYPGSITEVKHSVLTKHPEKQLKTVAKQDGTNSLLKNKKESIYALFEGYHTLVREVHSKFRHDKILLCEVLLNPIRASRANEAANQRIQQYNEKMKQFCNENVQELKTVLTPSCNNQNYG